MQLGYSRHNLIWLDLEMTGLDPEKDVILEVAVIITDAQLTLQVEGPSLVIHQSNEVLDNMNIWCVKQHGKSGLTQRVKDSRLTVAEVEQQVLQFLQQYSAPNWSPMCGNSVHQDRRFLVKYMPKLAQFFHYRNLDVSVFKELAKRWRPELLAGYSKKNKHLALDDIRESIDELKYYKNHWLENSAND